MLSTPETTVSGRLKPERGVATAVWGSGMSDPELLDCRDLSAFGLAVLTGEVGRAVRKPEIVRRIKKTPTRILTISLVLVPG